jgi:4-hydroxybenzoate polyprenyltransferase
MRTLFLLIKSLRLKQWTKNLFVFAGILFSKNVLNPVMLPRVAAAFAVFCLLSGAVYIINDLCDIKKDRDHPKKSHRPLASGNLRPSAALVFLACIVPLALVCSFLLGMPFFLTTVAYVVLQLAYSFYLKHIVILDVFSIAAGFVLRVIAGALVISVSISSWLVICTILLSLFLGLSKRRHELKILEDEAQNHRKVLEHYSLYLLDQMIAVVTASTLVSYSLYTMSEETVRKFGTTHLVYTVPFVLYGIFRYLYLIHKKDEGGNPETILVSDKPLLFSIFLWALTAGIILY